MKRFLLLLCVLFIIPQKLIFSQSKGLVKTVVIDAGHGGRDPGTSGKTTKEKDIVLAIALKTGKYIEDNIPGVKVIYTRKTDKTLKLYQRAKIANDANADLFISIHANWFQSPKVHGSETYVMGLHKTKENLAVAQKENAAILQEEDYMENYEGFDPNSPEAYIIFSLYQNAFLDQSLSFASKVESQFKNRAGIKSRGVKQAGFLVLHQVKMPSVLIEAGYLSSAKDEKYLKSKQGQAYIASAIYRAFREYKKEYEENTLVATSPPKKKIEKKKNPNIIYRVQIASSKRDIRKQRKFKNFKDLYVYKQNKTYKYCIGKEKTQTAANRLKNKLRNTKFKDAFVVAFLDGRRISLEKAKEMLKN